jgi:hypothetical protein
LPNYFFGEARCISIPNFAIRAARTAQPI